MAMDQSDCLILCKYIIMTYVELRSIEIISGRECASTPSIELTWIPYRNNTLPYLSHEQTFSLQILHR